MIITQPGHQRGPRTSGAGVRSDAEAQVRRPLRTLSVVVRAPGHKAASAHGHMTDRAVYFTRWLRKFRQVSDHSDGVGEDGL